MRLATFALAALLLALPAASGAAVRSGLDRHGGMRLTLDGRVLTAEIVKTPRIHRDPTTEERLFGRTIDAICSPTSRPLLRQVLIRSRRWPEGARSMPFVFGRDISRRVKWCLIEHNAADVAFVSFVEREPVRFLGKGRGPSGEWWRLGGSRGLFAEPCARVRVKGFSFNECFQEFSDRRITLGVRGWAPCEEDFLVYGVVSRRAANVRVPTEAGPVVEANLFDPAEGSRVRGRYFLAALPEGTIAGRVQSLDAEGKVLASRLIEGQGPGPCPS